MAMWVGIIGGILMPVLIYAVNFIKFKQKKIELERKTGVEIQANWSIHSYMLLFSFYPYLIFIHILLMVGAHWLHPDFGIATFLLFFFQSVFLGMPYYAIKGLRCGFFLSEFLTPGQMIIWYEDKLLSRGQFWWSECDRFLSNEIVHGDYIPMIQDTIPFIEEKRRYLTILENLSKRPLSDYEAEVQASTEALLKLAEDELDRRWQDLLVAIGRNERPEVLDKRKAESVREFESLVKQGVGAGEAQKQVDPALKELYALTQNEEAPADIKELAQNAIRDIETKLQTEEQAQREETIRRSAEVVIHTSRQFHGV